MSQYLPIFALGVLAVVFCVLSLMASRLLAPRRPTQPKDAPYECGIVPARAVPERFPVRFFLVAMIFIVFDVEIVFLYPWAVSQGSLGLFGLVAILIFSFAVFESFVYLIGKGALEWGASKHPRDAEQRNEFRSAQSTILRVGPESDRPGMVVEQTKAQQPSGEEAAPSEHSPAAQPR